MEGTVISASYQYEGRGQIGRFWESKEGKNITCSTILYPSFLEAQNQFFLNMAVSLAVYDLICSYLPGPSFLVRVKWPNDIYVDDRKIAGILIQNVLKGKSISSSVVGIGINVNQIHFSEDIPNPTSLRLCLDRDLDLDEVFRLLFVCLTRRYDQLTQGASARQQWTRQEYLSALYRRNQWASFQMEDQALFIGKIIEVDDIGRLKIQLQDGRIDSFAFREIQFVI